MPTLSECRRYFLASWLILCAVAALHLLSHLFNSDWSRAAWFGAALAIGAALGHLAHARWSEQPRIAPASRRLLLAGAGAGAALALLDPSFIPLAYALTLGLGGTLFYLYAYLPLPGGGVALRVGASAPDFALQDQRGAPIDRQSLLGQPALLVFIRGSWSPLCRAQLRELVDWCALHPPARKSRILVICAQPASKTEQLALELPAAFCCCVDPQGQQAAAAFGVARPNSVPWGLWGHGIDSIDPALVVLNAEGQISYADIASHLHQRPLPQQYMPLLGREPLALTDATGPGGPGGDADATGRPADASQRGQRGRDGPAAGAQTGGGAQTSGDVRGPSNGSGRAAAGAQAPMRLKTDGSAAAPLRPAATVALLRNGGEGLETLLLRRGGDATFLASTWVFPGGRVDPGDCAAGESDSSEAAARRAGVRETDEETGLSLPPQALAPFAHWTAPRESPKRYATWFFLALLDDPARDVVVDGAEIVAHQWLRPDAALAAQAAGEMPMLPPTIITLHQLCDWPDTDAATRHFLQRPVEYFEPKIVVRGDSFCNLYREDAGYANAELEAPGPRHRFWMRPGDWRYERDFDAGGEPPAHAAAKPPS